MFIRCFKMTENLYVTACLPHNYLPWNLFVSMCSLRCLQIKFFFLLPHKTALLSADTKDDTNRK